MRNIKTVAILASADYLPHLRACIKSILTNFSSSVDINVAWFSNGALPMLPRSVNIHVAEGSSWAFPLGNTTEQILASRPAFIKFLLKERQYNQVLHIGSDVMFYSVSDWVFDAHQGYDTAACPHSCAPYPQDGKRPSDLQIFRTGHINSDFVLYNARKYTFDFLDFQINEHNKCFGIDLKQGHFYDQGWLSFLPYYTDCKILKDPRLNVAYYNLHERKIIRTEPDKYWVQISEVPNVLYQLSCFQFTGFNPKTPHILSRYNDRPEIVNSDVMKLCLEYVTKLEEAGWQQQ